MTKIEVKLQPKAIEIIIQELDIKLKSFQSQLKGIKELQTNPDKHQADLGNDMAWEVPILDSQIALLKETLKTLRRAKTLSLNPEL